MHIKMCKVQTSIYFFSLLPLSVHKYWCICVCEHEKKRMQLFTHAVADHLRKWKPWLTQKTYTYCFVPITF